jgi:hypothetical protein
LTAGTAKEGPKASLFCGADRPSFAVLPWQGGKDGFHGSNKLESNMPPPPMPPLESSESCCYNLLLP